MSARQFSENINRDDVVSCAVQFLEIQKQYKNTKVLGSGTFGDVRLMYDPRRASDIAVKIVRSECRSESESTLWPKLRHPNVVHLLECFKLRTPSVEIYVMPVQRSTLWNILVKEQLYKDGDAMNKLTGWMHQILCGLEYLHSEEMCHLDLKSDNVLVSNESVAMLCDFTFLNETTKPLGRRHLGLPFIFRPPQACPSLGPDVVLDGKSFDLWSYGVMVLEIFTRFPISIHLKETNCWLKDHYPLMFEIMQMDNFFLLMSKAFIGVQLKKFLAVRALNFIQGFLMVDCKKRMSAAKATQHHFLKKGIVMGPPPDSIWISKVSSDDETCAAFKERCLRNCSIKDKTSSKVEDRNDPAIEDMDYKDSIKSSNQKANDDPSMCLNEDDFLEKQDGGNRKDKGEPNRILGYIETDQTIIGVNSEGDNLERTKSNKKFTSSKLLPKFTNRKKQFEQKGIEECNNLKEWTEIGLESNVEEETYNLPGMSELRLEINIENIVRYMNERKKSEGLKIDYFPNQAYPDLYPCKVELIKEPCYLLGNAHLDHQESLEGVFEGGLKQSIENPACQSIVFESVDEDKNDIIGSQKVGRGRKVIQWLRSKCLKLEKVVKRRPYKMMKQ